MYKPSNYLITSDYIDEEQKSRLLFATRTGSTVIVSNELWKNISESRFEKLTSEELFNLISIEAIVRSDENEFKEILERNKMHVADSKMLTLTIQPTANCQLGCGYCGQVHSKKTMSENITQKIIDQIKQKLSKKDYTHLAIDWYGGEPLLGYSKIVEISKEIIAHCDAIGVIYSASIITNGLSLKEGVYKKLVAECKITHYQITLDGLAETHDSRRNTKKGEATFDIILKNIDAATKLREHKEYKSSIVIRINIDQTNHHQVEDLIDLLASYGLQDRGVGIDFKPIVNWGDNNAEEYSLNASQFGDLEIDFILHAVNRGFKFSTVLPSRNPIPCMVVKPDADVYDANGNIYPCYEFPYTPMYETEKYRIGNVLFHEDTYNQDAIPRNWNIDIEKNISYCPGCKLFPVCGGGCPKKWYSKEIGCPSFKANIEDRLTLEYILNKSEKI
jgi:uncharacterized protein